MISNRTSAKHRYIGSFSKRFAGRYHGAGPVALAGLLGLSVLAGCGADEAEVASDPVSTAAFDVSAGLGNALSTAATHQVSATDASGTTVVRVTIEPQGEVTRSGETVNATETTNQTTAPNGSVTESKTVTYWATDSVNSDRVRVVAVETPASNLVLDVTSNADLPNPVLINTNGSYYDGLVNQNAVRLGSASVNWALQANDATTAWACTVARTTYSSGVFSDCYLINPAGELQGGYRSIVTEGNNAVIFQ